MPVLQIVAVAGAFGMIGFVTAIIVPGPSRLRDALHIALLMFALVLLACGIFRLAMG